MLFLMSAPAPMVETGSGGQESNQQSVFNFGMVWSDVFEAGLEGAAVISIFISGGLPSRHQ